MRTIFITPVLWKQLNRAAIRRGEEGQAIVLIALASVAMIAMVGLAVDGGLGYLEATRLQRAADAGALAGVVWIQNNRPVSDARAQLAAESYGVKVACYYDNSGGANPVYNDRCKRANWNEVTSKDPGARFYFASEAPIGIGIQYRVILGEMQQRFFLGILGFPNYPIVRTATAAFSQLVKFGSSFNYYGTFGVLYDHYMRCDNTNLANCDGGSDLDMRGATYQRYVVMRCEQPNAPPLCVGGFWGHIAGPGLNHSNGDGYTPIRDGSNSNCSYSLNSVTYTLVNNGGCTPAATAATFNCAWTQNKDTWYTDAVFDQTTGGSCPQIDANNFPRQNQDFHPDALGPYHAFGYELAVQVDPKAIYKYSDTVANVNNFTNVNITIFDGAEDEQTGAENFATSDNYQPVSPSIYAKKPYENLWGTSNANANYLQNITNPTTLAWRKREFICSPGSTGCGTAGVQPTLTGFPTPQLVTNAGDVHDSRRFPDMNNLQYSYNDVRTRLELYEPPQVPTIPSVLGNLGAPKYAFEMTDMSIRNATNNVGGPIENTGSSGLLYCYIMFDDQKAFWDNGRSTGADKNLPTLAYPNQVYTGLNGQGGSGPDYAYTAGNGAVISQDSRYAYVCPPATIPLTAGNVNQTTWDLRWNKIQGSPAARYGTQFNSTRTVAQEILETKGGSDLARSPIVTGSNVTSGISQPIASTSAYDPSAQGKSSIWDLPGGTYSQIVDPFQNCRRSAIDIDHWPVDPLWGHNRIPFNMAYADPLVSKAWITGTVTVSGTSFITNPVAVGNVKGYYTLHYGFHGWRCDWDFDSNYTLNPLQDPTQPPGPTNQSLTQLTRGVGPVDKAFVEGHPGLASNTWMQSLLNTDGASNASYLQDKVPSNNTNLNNKFLDTDFGLEPYFHLTNLQISGGGVAVKPTYNDNTAPMRAGTYMVHIQTWGNGAANRYSLKAEYENARTITFTTGVSGTVYNIKPVPSVYALTAMALYANNFNNSGVSKQDQIFDMAFIPPENAGTLGVLQLWDPGDISGDLNIYLLQPSTYGPRIKTFGNPNPYTVSGGVTTWNWQVITGAPLQTRMQVCDYTLNRNLGLNAGCAFNSTLPPADFQQLKAGGPAIANDAWVLLSFSIPDAGVYANYKTQCDINKVPESLCYYYQIDYQLVGASARANDTTTWQLVIQGQPVHLVVD